MEACCDQPARGSLCRKQKSPRSVHAKLTKAKISSGCSPSSGYLRCKRKTLFSPVRGRVARQSEFSFCGLTSAIQKRFRFRPSLSTGQRVFVRQGLPRAGLNHFFLAPSNFERTLNTLNRYPTLFSPPARWRWGGEKEVGSIKKTFSGRAAPPVD